MSGLVTWMYYINYCKSTISTPISAQADRQHTVALLQHHQTSKCYIDCSQDLPPFLPASTGSTLPPANWPPEPLVPVSSELLLLPPLALPPCFPASVGSTLPWANSPVPTRWSGGRGTCVSIGSAEHDPSKEVGWFIYLAGRPFADRRDRTACMYQTW